MQPMSGSTARALAALLLALGQAAGAEPVTVIEYYNPALDHYFISPLQPDIDALDSGRIAGWNRTGYNFAANDANPADSPAASPVCRYYIPPQHGDSHFFSAAPDECAAVAARIGTDPDYSGYMLETAAAFRAVLPNTLTGECPAGLAPVFRLWNQRADSNHRYTADAGVRADMVARGYLAEGYGPLGVAMCSAGEALGDARVAVSGRTPYPPGCDSAPVTGALYANAEVEPMLAANPQNAANLLAVWQQDRWSDGGARGLGTGYSFDGGRTWHFAQAAFTRCSGGNTVNGGDYARASDPWVSLGPSGIAYQVAIAFNGATFTPGSASAVLASRSLDGGATWSAPATLIRDGPAAFNDKESITADGFDANLAYAVWDRLVPTGNGPTWFARTIDGGATWEPARAIYDPGGDNQTLNNQIVVNDDGSLVLFFSQLTTVSHVTTTTLHAARSVDKGVSWSAPVQIATSLSIGTHDPQTGTPIRDGSGLGSIAAGPGGTLAVVWQDARFAGDATEGVAFSVSRDGGATWSPPAQVNRVPTAQALLPAVAVRADGSFGVLYYDLRNDTPDADSLFTDVWLAQSADGFAWTEQHVAGPFDLHVAPLALEDEGNGYFVGDYQALVANGALWQPLFVQTTSNAANRTDAVASILGAASAELKRTKPYVVRFAAAGPPAGAFAAAVSRNMQRVIERRRMGVPSPNGSR